MIYRDFKGLSLSMLGFGTMRLPLKEDGAINEELVAEMTDYALSHGVNYIDTAWPYMNNRSEMVMGRILEKYPRDSYYLATKYPGHMIVEKYDPQDVFERQLKKLRTDYFDFYLLHNVYENSIQVYEDPQWGIIDYFLEQRRLGRIKHLGFSCHGDIPLLKEFLDKYGDEMEFCQIQMNWLDWKLQKAEEKYRILTERGIPVWIMEPVRGGKLASLEEADLNTLHVLHEGSAASFGFRWTQQFRNVTMVLSGMSSMEQMIDNVASFDHEDPTGEAENAALEAIAASMMDLIPCTACRYCCDGCPMGLDIPDLLYKYNQLRGGAGSTIAMQLDAFPEDKLPSACIGCGACAAICPQRIAIPDELAKFTEALQAVPKWADICKAREEAEKKARAEENA
ncbi:MAG: aldo/keto reductase [Solobacterium sp.]|nr:aldo/keto reductase [Solobacterium sp.]